MISLDDCIGFCGLTDKEVMAIAEHEHVPDIVAAVIGRYLLEKPAGPEKIRDMMRDDIHDALSRGDKEHASDLLLVLRQFLASHPEARRIARSRPTKRPRWPERLRPMRELNAGGTHERAAALVDGPGSTLCRQFAARSPRREAITAEGSRRNQE